MLLDQSHQVTPPPYWNRGVVLFCCQFLTILATSRYESPLTTMDIHLQTLTTNDNQSHQIGTIHNHPQPLTPPTTTHNPTKPLTATHSHSEPPTTTRPFTTTRHHPTPLNITFNKKKTLATTDRYLIRQALAKLQGKGVEEARAHIQEMASLSKTVEVLNQQLSAKSTRVEGLIDQVISQADENQGLSDELGRANHEMASRQQPPGTVCSLSLPPSLSLSHTHTLSLSHTHTLSLSHTLSLTHKHTHTHTLSLSLSLSLPLSPPLSLSLSLSLSLFLRAPGQQRVCNLTRVTFRQEYLFLERFAKLSMHHVFSVAVSSATRVISSKI